MRCRAALFRRHCSRDRRGHREDEEWLEWLFEVAEEMDPEDGQLWVVGVGEDGVMAFTDDGIENLKELIAIHKEDPSIIEKRRHVLAAMIKPKNEESDGV